jgi:hypothetical protein
VSRAAQLSGMLLSLFCPALAFATEDSIKFQPAITIYECPATFTLRAECTAYRQALPALQLALGPETFGMKLASWDFRSSDPVPAIVHVLVAKTKRNGGGNSYSLSLEVGLAGNTPPMAKAQAEFRETAPPDTLTAASATANSGGKSYVVEAKISDFHGNLPIQRPPANAL